MSNKVPEQSCSKNLVHTLRSRACVVGDSRVSLGLSPDPLSQVVSVLPAWARKVLYEVSG